MMKMYFSPFVLLESASIVMTVSQLGELGFDPNMAAQFIDWWDANHETVEFFWGDSFNPNNPATYPEGFFPNDPYSWEILLDFPPNGSNADDPFQY